MPSFCSSFAVPPVERISMPSRASSRASSTIPDLSETLTSARLTFSTPLPALPLDAKLQHLGAQRVAVDSEHLGGERLVPLGEGKHRFDHRLLDVFQHHFVNRGRLLAIHVLEITLKRPLDAIGELVLARQAASLAK